MRVIPEIEIIKEKNEKHAHVVFSCVKERKFAVLNTTISYF